MALTQRQVDAIRPTGKPFKRCDRDGLMVRVTAAGKARWVWRGGVKGSGLSRHGIDPCPVAKLVSLRNRALGRSGRPVSRRADFRKPADTVEDTRSRTGEDHAERTSAGAPKWLPEPRGRYEWREVDPGRPLIGSFAGLWRMRSARRPVFPPQRCPCWSWSGPWTEGPKGRGALDLPRHQGGRWSELELLRALGLRTKIDCSPHGFPVRSGLVFAEGIDVAAAAGGLWTHTVGSHMS